MLTGNVKALSLWSINRQGRVKRQKKKKKKKAFEQAQNAQIQIIPGRSKYRPGLCPLFIHSLVSSDCVSEKWRPLIDCVDAHAYLGFPCPHMPEDTFSHCAAQTDRHVLGP